MKKPTRPKFPQDDPPPNADSEITLRDQALPKMIRCVICDSETQEGSPEQMCWVCRRLKISAWRDTEQQMPAQE